MNQSTMLCFGSLLLISLLVKIEAWPHTKQPHHRLETGAEDRGRPIGGHYQVLMRWEQDSNSDLDNVDLDDATFNLDEVNDDTDPADDNDDHRHYVSDDELNSSRNHRRQAKLAKHTKRSRLLSPAKGLFRSTRRRSARTVPPCGGDTTGTKSMVCQQCSKITMTPGAYNECCDNVYNAYSWCKRIFDFTNPLG